MASNFSCTEYLCAILKASLYKIAKVTPLQEMKKTSKKLKNLILAKREDCQIVHSFKLRGAFNMINNLNYEQKYNGIITASAGNHAQGVALSAKKLDIKSVVVMPIATSDIKIQAVKDFGSEIILFGENFDEAQNKAIELSNINNQTFIPPFDHPLIISGQGTLAIELIKQEKNLNFIFVPVGGGGLIAGIAVFIKQIIPKIKIIAVEANDSACLQEALKFGKPVDLPFVGLFAEGVAVKRIGKENFRICNLYIDDIITVDNDSICSAIKDIFNDTRAIAEPAGALALAGIKKYIHKYNIKNKKIAYILSGSNTNFHSLRYISERCEIGEKQEVLLAISIPEKKGSFLKFCNLLSNYIITEFNYRYSENNLACIFIGIKLIGIKEKNKIINLIIKNRYDVVDLSDNEIAKLHIRYMIGGKPKNNIYEKIYSFVFPESRGALLKFLKTIGNVWNITLFHYKYYGTDYGKVLIGFEIEREFNLEKHLTIFEYKYRDETLNPAFNLIK